MSEKNFETRLAKMKKKMQALTVIEPKCPALTNKKADDFTLRLERALGKIRALPKVSALPTPSQ